MDTLARNVNNVPDIQTRRTLFQTLQGLYDRYSSQALQSAGLVIKAGGSTLAKSGGAATKLLADGKLVNIAASTDQAALAGTVTNAKFNVYCFFIDSAANLTSAMGTEGASLAAVKFPTFPTKKALVGFIIINPTGTGNFVGGTTPLDDATVVPNAVFISPQGPFDPSAQV